MLKLERRLLSSFLAPGHQSALKRRRASAATLANQKLSSVEKSRRIGHQWDAFRAGRTSKDTFSMLWAELLDMAFSKCALCESAGPGTVEHLEGKSKTPARAFDWENLLPACDHCNRSRQNTGIASQPLDPSDPLVEPLDYFGWDEFCNFAPNPAHAPLVQATVRMYDLRRLRRERESAVMVVRTMLTSLVTETPTQQNTILGLRSALDGALAHRGAVREYLLRPPSHDDAFIIDSALELWPEFRQLVQPWLRPPAWAKPRWP